MWPAEGRTAVGTTTAGWCYDILTLFNYRYTPEQRGNPMGHQRRTRSARREGAILRDHMTSYSAFHHATIRDRFAQTHTYTSMPPSSSSASMDRRERTMGRRGRGDNEDSSGHHRRRIAGDGLAVYNFQSRERERQMRGCERVRKRYARCGGFAVAFFGWLARCFVSA